MPTIGAIAGMNMIMTGMNIALSNLNNKDMSTIETIKQDLIGLVKGHDWSYMMSDSHQVWEAGNKVERSIMAKIHALCAIHKEDAEALYSEIKDIAGEDYSDKDANGNGLKYRTINSWFTTYVHWTTIHPEL